MEIVQESQDDLYAFDRVADVSILMALIAVDAAHTPEERRIVVRVADEGLVHATTV